MSVQLADQPDSARLGHQANGSEEPPAAASSTNGFHEILAAPGSDPIQSRQNHHGTGSAPDPQFLNPGPSCRANKGSSSSIPYIDCSDIDSECDVTKNNRATRGHSNAKDRNADEPCVYNNKHGGSSRNGGQAGSLFGVVNGFYHTNHQGLMQQHQQQGIIGLHQQQQGMLGNRSPVDQSPVSNKFHASHELTDEEILPNGGSFHGRLPLHSTLLDEIFQGRDKRGAATGRPLGTGTRSQCSSPVISSFHHRTNSFSHTEMTNGHGQPRSAPRWDDGGHYFSKRPGVVPVETPVVPPSPQPANPYGSYSPITSNRTPPHFAKPYNNNNMRNRSDTDPFILSQLTSTPIHHHDPHRSGLHAQAPCSAPMERRMIITNGNHAGNLVVPGQARSNTVQRLFGRQGKPSNNPTRNNHNNLNQPVQMIDGSTSSGTDTSDTESDTGSSAYSQPLMYGNPVAVSSMNSVNSNGVNSSPLPRSKFSFGSLQLGEGDDGEGEEEEGCYRFNEEDIGERVFSC